MIYQELVPPLRSASQRTSWPGVCRAEVSCWTGRRSARRLGYGRPVSGCLTTRIRRSEALSQHERQLVEIAKALSNRPSIVVFDEPTSALSRSEVERLFGMIRDLKADGLAIIYVSHHLSEVFVLSDRCTVLRDGRKVETRPMSEMDPGKPGGDNDRTRRLRCAIPRRRAPGEVRLRVKDFSRYGFFHACQLGSAGRRNFRHRRPGRRRAQRAGPQPGRDRPCDAGEISLDGSPLVPASLRASMRRGLAYVTEDRKMEGLALLNTASENTLSALNSRRARLVPAREGGDLSGFARDLQFSPPEPNRQAAQFSGGNQQKILLAKWLATTPEVIILDEPTRGVDVGAKQVIHKAIGRLADSGKCVLLISSDLPELVGLSDRVVILEKGICGELQKNELSEEAALLSANAKS